MEASLVESCEGEDEMGAERGVHVFRVVLHGVLPVVGPPRYVAHCPVLVMPARRSGGGCSQWVAICPPPHKHLDTLLANRGHVLLFLRFVVVVGGVCVWGGGGGTFPRIIVLCYLISSGNITNIQYCI